MTAGEEIVADVFARLIDPVPARLVPAPASGEENIRRTHLVAVPRDNAPAVYLYQGDDVPRNADKTASRTCRPWTRKFRVSVFVRDDAPATADPLVEEVLRRMDPTASPYSYGTGSDSARLTLLSRSSSTEIADGDAGRVDLDFEASYDVSGWGLT